MSPRAFRPDRGARRVVLLAACAVLGLAPVSRAAVNVEARLSMDSIEPGGVASLIVTVTDPNGSVGDPQFSVPAGLELLGSSRSQQFTWVNGRSTNQVTFRLEIAGTKPGRYTIGPIRVQVGSQTYRSGEESLTVAATAPDAAGGGNAQGGGAARTARGSGGRGAGDVASLVVTLEPPSPVVGQACRLRVQLVQRVDMSEESQYDPPATPGFWSESWSDLSRSQAREGRRSVIITESSLRLYPLAPGPAVITPARGVVTPSGNTLWDPFGGLAGRPVQIRSESLRVAVRPLPGGGPAAFDGGVGEFTVSWDADREHTTQDQAVTARLEVRGLGNLPLLRAPAYTPADFDVFATTVEDSFPAAGALGRGRRSFVWTLLPRRAGHLRLSSPTLAWFDPSTSRYVSSTPAPLEIEVISARPGSDAEDADGLPTVFRSRPARPGGRAAWPPLALMGGWLVAIGAGAWRRSRGPDPGAADRARLREWLRSVGLVRGPDFWRTADEVSGWLHERGEQVLRLREAIAAARFGGRTDEEEDVRRKLIERLAASIPPPPARWPLQWGGAALVLAGVIVGVLSLPRSISDRRTERAAAADTRARAGDVPGAEAEWARLWDETPGDPALAARLAWSALTRDDVAAATVWVLRGDRLEARDPALRAMAARVRDAGGLVGAPGRALPLRSYEWALLAFLLGVLSGVLWPRRAIGPAVAAAACVAGAWWPLETAWRARQELAVVRSSVPLPPTGVTLDSGQVVRVKGRSGEGLDVRAASDLEGTLPRGAVWILGRR